MTEPDAASAPLQGTASQHLTTAVPLAEAHQRAGEVLRSLEGRRFDSADVVTVVEEGRFVGLVRFEDLLAAPPHTPLEALLAEDPPVVAPDAGEEAAALRAVERGWDALAVVDGQGRFLGLVPAVRLLEVLLRAHDEDVARFGGFLKGAESARGATEEPLARRLKHRLPWLGLGLLGALGAASVVGAFEESLARNLAVAFFIPSIVYLADAVGAQTEALLVRGLSVGVIIRRVVVKELLTGLLLGVLLGALAFPAVLWRWGAHDVALAVGLAVAAASTAATAVAVLTPWGIHRLGGDPAFASGPVATVVLDILSVSVYLLIASAIVR